MGVAETEALVAKLKGGVGKAIAEDREPTVAELGDVLDLIGDMAVNLARIAEREPQVTVNLDPQAIGQIVERSIQRHGRKV